MPINGDILGMQRRSLPIGEIRMGTSVAVAGKDYRKPVRLETWRFTTASEAAVEVVAAKYGGKVAPWERKKGRWEVITDRTAIDVWVPPRGEAVDANMELWNGPKCLRRCDGVTMSLPSRRPCQCPQPDDPRDPVSVMAARAERDRLAGLRPPQACKVLTRISVTIPDLPGLLGVWRLNTGSVNAAVETGDSGEAMAIAREGGVYLPAVLRMEWRVRSADGSPYQVPVLQIGLSMRELADGALPAGPGGLLAQLRGPDAAGRRALPAGDGDAVPAEPPPLAAAGLDSQTARAEGIAARARSAKTRPEITVLATESNDAGLGEEYVEDGPGDTFTQLADYLRDLWRKLPEPGQDPAEAITEKFRGLGFGSVAKPDVLKAVTVLAGRDDEIQAISDLDPAESAAVLGLLGGCGERGDLMALLIRMRRSGRKEDPGAGT
jgi:hypothetical protein